MNMKPETVALLERLRQEDLPALPLDDAMRVALRDWLQRCIADTDHIRRHAAYLRLSPLSPPCLQRSWNGGAFAAVERRVCERALEDFDDAELVHLATHVGYLWELNMAVSRAFPAAWMNILETIGREHLAAAGLAPPERHAGPPSA